MTSVTKFTQFLLLVFGLFLAQGVAIAQGDPAEEPKAESIVEGDPATTAAADADVDGDGEAEPAAADGAVAEGEGDYNIGKTLWNANGCGSCHAKDMKSNLTGPALGGVEERWAAEPRDHLYRWIRQSQALIASGESQQALNVWNAWKPTVMSNFTNLSDADMEHLLAYIDGQYRFGGDPNAPSPGPIDGDVVEEEEDNTWLFIVLGGILLLLSIVLARITANMQYMVASAEGAAPANRKTLVQVLTSRGVIAFAVFAAVVLAGYTTVNHAIELGRQQDYQPEQPIKFSHATHSGIHQIECQYCHDGARRSKHSVIPAVNTCMNCHRAIEVGSRWGTAELTKIFAAIGWDPIEDAYIANYDEMSNDQAREIYSKWIAQEYMNTEDYDVDEIENVVGEQWEGIVAALTNDYTGDDRIPGPIEWTRIHNLPDHAYFNHAQHVTVGNLKCQNCHGQVQEMEVVYQYSPLSMGWCINCHRETQVQGFEDNDYYQAYERYHEEIKSGERDGVTVEDLGGLNCQRCHY